MSIVSGDLMLFASAQMNDAAYGGGRMSSTVVQDGVTNNTFPPVDVAAMTAGRVQLRKIYAAVVSDNNDLASSGQINFVDDSNDALVDEVAFVYGDHKTERAAAIAQLQKFPYRPTIASQTGWSTVSSTTVSLGISIPNGTLLAFYGGSFAPGQDPSSFTPQLVTWVVSKTGSGPYITTIADSISGGSTSGTVYVLEQNPAAPVCVGIATLDGSSSGATVPVDRVKVPVVPQTVPYPVTVNGIDPAPLKSIYGRVPIFRIGDSVILRQGATTERALVSFVDHNGGLTFSAALANSYTAGATVSSLGSLGNMQASVGASFSQQTWTKSFSDTLIGSSIAANYDRVSSTIGITNFGGQTERWAIVFTSGSAFKLIGETVGEIATGSTASLFEPNNPLTGEPYFSIPSAGWGSGWAIGNVLRFNTIGARAPFWEARTVSPGAGSSSDSMTIEFCVTV